MPGDSLRSILVASDLSPESDGVVGAAAALAAHTGARLHVLHALDTFAQPFRELALGILELQGRRHEARERLDEQLRRTLPAEVQAGTVKLAHQAASEAILRRAAEVNADLIVVGPHRGRLPGSHLLGTTGQRVVEGAAVPCLVTRQPVPLPLRRVLLPVSVADARTGLLAAGSRWVARLRARQELSARARRPLEIRALHVINAPAAWRDFSGTFSEVIRSINDHPEVGLHVQVRRAVAWSRSPAAEIVRVADDAVVDLIVLGVGGYGPLLRALLGSVSAGVLRHATRPVLLLPPRASERLSRFLDRDHEGRPAAPSRRARPAEAPPVLRDAEAEWHLSYLEADSSDEDDVEIAPIPI